MNKNLVAMTPPMGWNSWDCYGASVTEDILLANAQYMHDHLSQYGWEYVVCDIQWYEPSAGSTEYHPFMPLQMDEYSRLIPAANRFPSSANGQGFRPIAEKIHDLGLKFGIHIMRGIPRQAVHQNTSIKGSPAGARDLAQPFSLCKWNTDMYGIDPDAEDAQRYYDSLFELYAAWGVDYVKVDDICNTNYLPHAPYSAEREIEMISQALKKCGRSMVLSLSPGPAVIEKAWHLSKHANMWRITDDFWDDWDLLKAMFERCEVWRSHVKPGCWPDCDMLPIGLIRAYSPETAHQTHFTKDEQRTMLTLWCIFRSPLMIGAEMRAMDNWTLDLLTNDEVLRLLKYSYGADQVSRSTDQAIWFSHDEEGGHYVALFNLMDLSEKILSVDLAELGMTGSYVVRDLWARSDVGTTAKSVIAQVRPHGAALLKLTAI